MNNKTEWNRRKELISLNPIRLRHCKCILEWMQHTKLMDRLVLWKACLCQSPLCIGKENTSFSLRTVMLGQIYLADGVREIREGKVHCLLQVSKNISFVFICEEEVIFTRLFQNSRCMYSAEQNRKDLEALAGRTSHA